MAIFVTDQNAADKFLATLGEMLVRWNHLEGDVRLIVSLLSDEAYTTDILTAHMGNRSLTDGLRVLSNEFGPEPLRPHINHLIAFFDLMATYRNYYAHAIIAVVETGGAGVVGLMQGLSAKKRLTLHEDIATAESIKSATRHITTLTEYGEKIIHHLEFRRDDTGLPQALHPSLPEMPKLPPKLEKPRRHLLESEPPP